MKNLNRQIFERSVTSTSFSRSSGRNAERCGEMSVKHRLNDGEPAENFKVTPCNDVRLMFGCDLFKESDERSNYSRWSLCVTKLLLVSLLIMQLMVLRPFPEGAVVVHLTRCTRKRHRQEEEEEEGCGGVCVIRPISCSTCCKFKFKIK